MKFFMVKDMTDSVTHIRIKTRKLARRLSPMAYVPTRTLEAIHDDPATRGKDGKDYEPLQDEINDVLYRRWTQNAEKEHKKMIDNINSMPESIFNKLYRKEEVEPFNIDNHIQLDSADTTSHEYTNQSQPQSLVDDELISEMDFDNGETPPVFPYYYNADMKEYFPVDLDNIPF